mmetsp:Transcript_45338/g.78197  ORF Transcript_45338/g.78197 Transcript_45338/m.78197 type:complete len:409 (-) Transcript_45338:353-1579(-)
MRQVSKLGSTGPEPPDRRPPRRRRPRPPARLTGCLRVAGRPRKGSGRGPCPHLLPPSPAGSPQIAEQGGGSSEAQGAAPEGWGAAGLEPGRLAGALDPHLASLHNLVVGQQRRELVDVAEGEVVLEGVGGEVKLEQCEDVLDGLLEGVHEHGPERDALAQHPLVQVEEPADVAVVPQEGQGYPGHDVRHVHVPEGLGTEVLVELGGVGLVHGPGGAVGVQPVHGHVVVEAQAGGGQGGEGGAQGVARHEDGRAPVVGHPGVEGGVDVVPDEGDGLEEARVGLAVRRGVLEHVQIRQRVLHAARASPGHDDCVLGLGEQRLRVVLGEELASGEPPSLERGRDVGAVVVDQARHAGQLEGVVRGVLKGIWLELVVVLDEERIVVGVFICFGSPLDHLRFDSNWRTSLGVH